VLCCPVLCIQAPFFAEFSSLFLREQEQRKQRRKRAPVAKASVLRSSKHVPSDSSSAADPFLPLQDADDDDAHDEFGGGGGFDIAEAIGEHGHMDGEEPIDQVNTRQGTHRKGVANDLHAARLISHVCILCDLRAMCVCVCASLFVQWESDGVCVDSLLPAGASREAELARLAQSYEDLCKEHVDAYLKSAQEFLSSSLLSRRVLEWQERLQPILEEEERHKPFDIHAYGRDILTAVDENKNEEQGRSKETHRGRTIALTHHLLTAPLCRACPFVFYACWIVVDFATAVRGAPRYEVRCTLRCFELRHLFCALV
jgi:hypothetical protein